MYRVSFLALISLLLLLSIAQDEPFTQTGTASYYADKFHKKPTSSGEKYDKKGFTAAHKSLPFGTWILVTNLKNDSTVMLKVNDRIGTSKRIIDVSRAGAEQLNFIRNGLTTVKIEEIVVESEATDEKSR